MSEVASEAAVPASARLPPDPVILASIGSPVAPTGMPAPVAPPDSLPGSLGVIEGVKALYGTLRHGIAHSERMQARHGEIYRTMYMAEPIVAVSSPDELHKILRNEQGIWSAALGWDFLFFDGLNSEGGNPGSLLTLDFDAHRSARKVVQPAFTSTAIKGYIDIARPLIQRGIDAWVADGGVAFAPAMAALWPSISNCLLTGIEDPAQLRRFDRALRDISYGMQALVRTRFLNPLFRKARSAYGYLTDYFVALAPQRRQQSGTDLFSRLCQISTGQTGLSDHGLVRVFLTMLLGAHDSTALGITNTVYLLAKNPSWQERLREEADRIPSDALDWQGLQKLEELEWAWKESLRLIPVTDFVPRRALRDVEIRGHQLKAGTLIAPLAGVVGRHRSWWKNALEFDPERFSPARAEQRKHPAIFNPFGGGAHVCIGMQLATLEAKVFFHRLLTTCRFELRTDYVAGHTFRPLGSVTGKVRLKLQPR